MDEQIGAADEQQCGGWTRREAVARVCALLGGALVGQAAILAPSARAANAQSGVAPLDTAELALLDEVAETILPETETPGAKAAGVGPFMALMVADTYTPAEQRIFREGLASIERGARERYGVPFLAADAQQRAVLLEALDREQHDYMREREPDAPIHYFRMIKELALLGYFTSEIGCRQAQRYVEAPGRYDPCLPHAPGERAWAGHA
jgi:hypothetical protein